MDSLSVIWQRAMICLATDPGIRRLAQNNALAKGLAARFVGGMDPRAAVVRAETLARGSIASSFFFLGEYVQDPRVVRQTLEQLAATVGLAKDAGLDLHLSIDPTQAGLMQSKEMCQANIRQLARLIRSQAEPGRTNVLMMDMEDSRVTRDTLDIFMALSRQGLPLGITLQACLRRTSGDLANVMARGCPIRLVKGAFAEKHAIAFRPGPQTDQAFLGLAEQLLSPRSLARGNYPVFATHDHGLIAAITRRARAKGIDPACFEFEMLYGVRPKLQKALAGQGYRIRVYLPFGQEFWPYSVRRIGENPKNIRFLIRSLGKFDQAQEARTTL